MNSWLWRIFQNCGLIVTSLGLLYGGVGILRTGIPFWSLVYGIPAVFLGIILSLVSFNELAKNRFARATEYHQIPCRACGKMTLAPMLTESVVCTDCQYKMAVRLQMTVLFFFVLIAIPVTFHLTQQAQNIEQRAKIPKSSPQCEQRRWNPEVCRCAQWETEGVCDRGRGRICGDVSFCCEETSAGWQCELAPNSP